MTMTDDNDPRAKCRICGHTMPLHTIFHGPVPEDFVGIEAVFDFPTRGIYCPMPVSPWLS